MIISFMIVKLQGLNGESQSVIHSFLTNMRLFEFDLCNKKTQWADGIMQRQKQRIIWMKKCFFIEDDQRRPKQKPKGITQDMEVPTLQRKDKGVTESEKQFLGVSDEEDERPEAKVIKDDPKSGDDDYRWEGSDQEDDCAPESDLDDVRHNKPELESDHPRKIPRVGALDSSEVKKSDGSATIKAGEDHTSRGEHADQSDVSTRQLLPFDGTALLQLSAVYDQANVVDKEVNKQLIQNALGPPWLYSGSISKRQEEESPL